MGKSLPMIAGLLAELMKEGYVIESGFALSMGGLRPQLSFIKPGLMFVVTVAMDSI